MQINKRTLSELQISNVMKQSLAGLAYLHGQGKIHRDIKGGNILCDSNGMCKLADFGVSGNLDKTLGKHRTVIGTPHWMAPEVLMSDDYNELADIWSLGITAYELAIGEPPHAKLHSMRAALKIPMSPPPTLPDPGHWSEHFHSFLRSCLVKDFHARPSAIDLLSHPFVVNAANASVLMDMVRASVKAIEGKAAELSREQGLSSGGQAAAAGGAAAGGGAAAAGGGRASSGRASGSSGSAAAASVRDDATTVGMTGSSVGDVDDDIDADEDDVEDDQPRIRPNPRGSR
jgi:serine/threonine protein kinase